MCTYCAKWGLAGGALSYMEPCAEDGPSGCLWNIFIYRNIFDTLEIKKVAKRFLFTEIVFLCKQYVGHFLFALFRAIHPKVISELPMMTFITHFDIRASQQRVIYGKWWKVIQVHLATWRGWASSNHTGNVHIKHCTKNHIEKGTFGNTERGVISDNQRYRMLASNIEKGEQVE